MIAARPAARRARLSAVLPAFLLLAAWAAPGVAAQEVSRPDPSARPEADYLAGTGTVNNLSLVHPVAAVASAMKLTADRRWYAAFTGSPGGVVVNRFEPLLSPGAWGSVPAPLRHVVAALGLDDADLVLVSSNLNTGSISVYFVPSHDTDRAFYQGKCDRLARYIRGHDMDSELDLEQVLASPEEGADAR